MDNLNRIIAAHSNMSDWAKLELLRYAKLLERECPPKKPLLRLLPALPLLPNAISGVGKQNSAALTIHLVKKGK